jgi:glycerophosphoryl diester phosphodiesterase
MKKTRIVAHRGNSSQAPENTLVAFCQAIDMGVDAIELDVFLSADGIPVVIHDATLSRTTNAPEGLFVKDLTAKQLSELDAGSWFGPQYAGEKIPALKEVLQLDFKKTELFIELKWDDEQHIQPLVSAVLATIAAVRPKFPIVMGSFSQKIIDEIGKQASEQRVCGIVDEDKSLQKMVNRGLTYLSISDELATPENLAELCEKGIEVWVYTVNDRERGSQLSAMGVRGIVTDMPALFYEPQYRVAS